MRINETFSAKRRLASFFVRELFPCFKIGRDSIIKFICKNMGRLFLEYLDGDKVYCCKKCQTHLVDKGELVSKVGKLS